MWLSNFHGDVLLFLFNFWTRAPSGSWSLVKKESLIFCRRRWWCGSARFHGGCGEARRDFEDEREAISLGVESGANTSMNRRGDAYQEKLVMKAGGGAAMVLPRWSGFVLGC